MNESTFGGKQCRVKFTGLDKVIDIFSIVIKLWQFTTKSKKIVKLKPSQSGKTLKVQNYFLLKKLTNDNTKQPENIYFEEGETEGEMMKFRHIFLKI